MKTYQVLEPIKHNGKKYMPPCEIELEDNDAQTLIDCEAIVDIEGSEELAAKAEAEKLAAEEAAKAEAEKLAAEEAAKAEAEKLAAEEAAKTKKPKAE